MKKEEETLLGNDNEKIRQILKRLKHNNLLRIIFYKKKKSMIDIHAHLDFDDFKKDINQVIDRFLKQGGRKIVNIGTDLERSQKGWELSQKYPMIFCSVGCHPHLAEEIFKKNQGKKDKIKKDLEKITQCLEKLSEKKKVVAVGETGLDYFHQKKKAIRKLQEELFFIHLKIAQKRNLPVIIHCRNAYQELEDIIIKFFDQKMILHCYGGGTEITRKFLQFPWLKFSFCGNITYFKNSETDIFKVIKIIPQEKILAETDCPFLAPVPFRGKRNEPAFMLETIKKIAQIKNKKIFEMEKILDQNANIFFDFEKNN